MFTMYLCLAVVGFALMFFTFLLGGGHDADHDPGHEFGHDVGHDMEHDAEHDTAKDSGHQIHWFSTKVVSAFLSFFGACGSIMMKLGMQPILTAVFSAVAGGIAGYLMNLLIEFLLEQQCNSTFSAQRLIGSLGMVRTSILPGMVGEIEVDVKGRKQVLRAKCGDAQAECNKCEMVEITGMSSSSILTVQKTTER